MSADPRQLMYSSARSAYLGSNIRGLGSREKAGNESGVTSMGRLSTSDPFRAALSTKVVLSGKSNPLREKVPSGRMRVCVANPERGISSCTE